MAALHEFAAEVVHFCFDESFENEQPLKLWSLAESFVLAFGQKNSNSKIKDRIEIHELSAKSYWLL